MADQDVPRFPLLALLRVLPRAGRARIATLGAMVLVGGLTPPAFGIATGVLIGAVPGAVEGGLGSPSGRRLVAALAVLAGLYAVEQVLPSFRDAVATTTWLRLRESMEGSLMAAMLRPAGVAHLEDPAVADRVTLATGREAGMGPPAAAAFYLVPVAVQYIAGLTWIVVLGAYAWWAPLAFIPGIVVTRRWITSEVRTIERTMLSSASVLRRAGYFRNLALTPAPAKESRVFGLGGWIVERFTGEWWRGMEPVWEERKRNRGMMILAVPAFASGYAVVIGIAAVAAANGRLGIGEIAVVLQAALGVFSFFPNDAEHMLRRLSVALAHTLRFETDPPGDSHPARVEVREATASAEGAPRSEIRFEGVSFSYPGNARPVYEDLNLTIPAGHSLAIVGENGAGKTTLVKLLARLYDPTGGRITVDGVDVRDLDVAAWRRRMGVIFQDFIRYELPARDNVELGGVERRPDAAALARAAGRAGADKVVAELEAGWDTLLSRQYRGGADLSGGQWQRLALARALYAVEAGAGVLILDEPTAALDVRAEAELFDRFLEITKGLTTILISHRFSSVRHADLIVVLEHGRVVEQGGHLELLARGGRYATMFNLQAARFRDGEPPSEDVALAGEPADA